MAFSFSIVHDFFCLPGHVISAARDDFKELITCGKKKKKSNGRIG
uniref:Uncharacterized protein n=1 Tax=Rhizophora mucronata TaxID=61149 RepID=A0A2P2K2A3_RHIMU